MTTERILKRTRKAVRHQLSENLTDAETAKWLNVSLRTYVRNKKDLKEFENVVQKTDFIQIIKETVLDFAPKLLVGSLAFDSTRVEEILLKLGDFTANNKLFASLIGIGTYYLKKKILPFFSENPEEFSKYLPLMQPLVLPVTLIVGLLGLFYWFSKTEFFKMLFSTLSGLGNYVSDLSDTIATGIDNTVHAQDSLNAINANPELLRSSMTIHNCGRTKTEIIDSFDHWLTRQKVWDAGFLSHKDRLKKWIKEEIEKKYNRLDVFAIGASESKSLKAIYSRAGRALPSKLEEHQCS